MRTTELDKFIEKIAYVGDSRIPDNTNKVLYSKIDGAFLSNVKNTDDLEFLLKKGITEQIQNWNNVEGNAANIGFNPTEQKWYGWSHRAIYGFGIGSECKLGDCGFKPSNKEEFIKRNTGFWVDEGSYAKKETVELLETENGVTILYIYNDEVPNEGLRGTTYKQFCEYPKEWGKGEWTATTLEEAKEMAIDFARSVS